MVDDRRKSRQDTSTCCRSGGWQSRYRTLKRGLASKIHLAVDAAGMPVRIIITAGTINDCSKADELVEGITAKGLIADRGYDTNSIVGAAIDANMQVIIPPKKNRKIQREYDKEAYRRRHLIENAFLALKRWRGIATRYTKNTKSFLAAVQIRCIAIQLVRCEHLV